MNELFTRHLLTAEECSEVAGKGRKSRENHLNQVLLIKPAEVVQEACPVLEKHGCPVKKLKSEFYYNSTPFVGGCIPNCAMSLSYPHILVLVIALSSVVHK